MSENVSARGGRQGRSDGLRCTRCSRIEPDGQARFCGACGGALVAAGGTYLHERYELVDPATPTGHSTHPSAPSTLDPWPDPALPLASPYQYAPSPYQQATAPSASTYREPAPANVAFTVPSVGFAGPARMAAAVGGAFTLLPSLLFAFVGSWVVHAGRQLLAGWSTAKVPIPVPLVNSIEINLNFLDLLHLHPAYDFLVYWDDRLLLVFAILWLTPWLIAIVASMVFGIVLAAIYNAVGGLGGGLRVTLRPTEPRPSPGRPSGAVAAGWPAEGRR
ncbi:MAG: hypothetical protein IT305_20255 [Chloroflexi bacterium]|nr:hypothetical protein [Chloroflexota bacterium]